MLIHIILNVENKILKNTLLQAHYRLARLTLMNFLYFLLTGTSGCLHAVAQSAENYSVPMREEKNIENIDW